MSKKPSNTVCPYCGLKAETAPDPSQIRPGTVLAQRYEVGFALKIGLYTITYIAYDLQREEKVIVKEYYPSQLCSRVDGGNRIGIRAGGEQKTFYERGLTQFLKEAKDLHSVSVPFLIPVQDVFTENATAYMVMPYLNGKHIRSGNRREETLLYNRNISFDDAGNGYYGQASPEGNPSFKHSSGKYFF